MPRKHDATKATCWRSVSGDILTPMSTRVSPKLILTKAFFPCWASWHIHLLLALGCGSATPALQQPKPPEVIVATPETRNVADYEDFTGWTESVASVELRSRVSGYLDRIAFQDGADVKSGDLLFEIDRRLYVAAAEEARAARDQALAHRDRTERDFQRVKSLAAKDARSAQDLDKAIGDRAETAAAFASAEAKLKSAEVNLDFTRITAPLSGRLSRRMIDQGNLVKADETALVSLVALDPMYALFDVDERTVLRMRRLIREGRMASARESKVTVQIGLADEEGFSREGTIEFIDNKIDSHTGTLKLRAVTPNNDLGLSPGLFIRVRLRVGQPRDALLVPEEAIGSDQGQKFLYVLDAENKVVYRRIKVGLQVDRLRAIDEGLQADDRVIVSGLQRVRPGIAVVPKMDR